MDLIGVVDTMFARYDMGGEALDELAQCPGYGTVFTTVRRTVPGFKDLAVQAKKLIEEEGCRIVVALGMPGKEQVDKVCAHEASTGIMTAQLMTNTPILEVFVHEDESDDPATLAMVFKNRSRDHARNAYLMLYEPEELIARAGQGVRRGSPTQGPSRSDQTGRSGSGIPGQPQHPLGHDVSLHLGRPAAHGEGGGEQEPPGPGRVQPDPPAPARPRLAGPDPRPGAGPDRRRRRPMSIPKGPARSRARSITCWPWASARALRTDASAPGWRPASTAETMRRRSTRKIRLSTHTDTNRSRQGG